MRNISIEHTDFDRVSKERWYDLKPGYLLTPHIAMQIYEDSLWLFCFDEAIREEVTVVKSEKSKIISIDIGGASLSGMIIEDIAKMSFVELAEVLAARRLSE